MTFAANYTHTIYKSTPLTKPRQFRVVAKGELGASVARGAEGVLGAGVGFGPDKARHTTRCRHRHQELPSLSSQQPNLLLMVI
jgi:hypothetical protein